LGLYLLHERNKPVEALAHFRTARAVRPDSPTLLINISIAHAQLEDWERAVAASRAALALEENAAARLQMSYALVRKGDTYEALREAHKCRALIPKDPELLRMLGGILNVCGDLVGAEAAYRDVLTFEPKQPGDLETLGEILAEREKWTEAVRAYIEASDLAPNRPEYHLARGVIQCDRLHDYAGAEVSFQKAIKAAPNDANAHLFLGNALVGLGDWQRAAQAFERAAQLDPKSVRAWRNLGRALRNTGKPDAAIRAYERAVALGPERAAEHEALGALYCDAKRNYPKAREHFERAHRLDGRSAPALQGLGMVRLQTGDPSGAVKAFEEAVACAPTSASAHADLGFGLHILGRPIDALRECEKAVRLDPNLPRAHANLGQVLLKAGRVRDADNSLYRVTELTPGDRAAWANWGAATLQTGNTAGALLAGNRAIALDATYSNGHLLRGLALLQQHDLAEARRALARAAQIDPRYRALLAEVPPNPTAPQPRSINR
jgi:tetratricopeptide (TPR) repeat protein